MANYFALNLYTQGGTITVGGTTYSTNKFVPNTTGYSSSYTFYTISTSGYTPTRSGYTFQGWSLSSTSSYVSVSAGGSYQVSTANASETKSVSGGTRYTKYLYAVWEKTVTTYTYYAGVKYDLNGGSGTFSNQTDYDTSTSSSGMWIDFTVRSGTPTKSGYYFKYWEDVSGNTYDAGDTFSVYTNGKSTGTRVYGTLTAQWGELKNYFALNLYTNGGTITVGGTTYNTNKFVPNTTGYEATSEYTISTSGYTPTRSGYVFMGWGLTDSSTAAAVAENGSLKVSTSTYTNKDSVTGGTRYSYRLYAIWGHRYYGKLVYDANGGSNAPSAQYNYDDSTDSYATLTYAVSSSKPTLSGQTFVKWNTKSDGSGDDYDGGDTLYQKATSTSSSSRTTTTLYAIWKSSYVTGENITLSYRSATATSVTIRASMAQSRPYSRTITISVSGHSGSGTISSGSTYVDITLSSLTAGTTYSASAVGTAPDSTKIGQSSSNLTVYTNFNFAWTYSKYSGGDFNLTATEWNSMTSKMVTKCSRYGESESFTTAVSNNNFTATIFNQVANAFHDIYGSYVISTVSSGSTVYASYLNDIVTYLNSNDN